MVELDQQLLDALQRSILHGLKKHFILRPLDIHFDHIDCIEPRQLQCPSQVDARYFDRLRILGVPVVGDGGCTGLICCFGRGQCEVDRSTVAGQRHRMMHKVRVGQVIAHVLNRLGCRIETNDPTAEGIQYRSLETNILAQAKACDPGLGIQKRSIDSPAAVLGPELTNARPLIHPIEWFTAQQRLKLCSAPQATIDIPGPLMHRDPPPRLRTSHRLRDFRRGTESGVAAHQEQLLERRWIDCGSESVFSYSGLAADRKWQSDDEQCQPMGQIRSPSFPIVVVPSPPRERGSPQPQDTQSTHGTQ